MEIVDLLDQLLENDEVVDEIVAEAVKNAATDVEMDGKSRARGLC